MSRGWYNKETVIEQKAILKKTRARNARPYNQRCEKTTARDVTVPVGGAHCAPVIEICTEFRVCLFVKGKTTCENTHLFIF
ncbi:MAG: hypothetical protein KHW90_06255 [Clostridiales bacterium]|nr:hypothetical protein [Clostridiales bacterium]